MFIDARKIICNTFLRVIFGNNLKLKLDQIFQDICYNFINNANSQKKFEFGYQTAGA